MEQNELERHAAIHRWVCELGIRHKSIASRIKGRMGITEKLAGGKIIETGFYSEAVVRDVCKVILPISTDGN